MSHPHPSRHCCLCLPPWTTEFLEQHAGHLCQCPHRVWWLSGILSLAGKYVVVFLVELLTVFEQWSGHKFPIGSVTRPNLWAGRRFSVSSPAISDGVQIRQGCQFIGRLIRYLGALAGRTFPIYAVHCWGIKANRGIVVGLSVGVAQPPGRKKPLTRCW